MPPRWFDQLPGFRMRTALRDTQARLTTTNRELKKARAELTRVWARADLSAGTLTDVATAMQSGPERITQPSRLEEILTSSVKTYRRAEPFPRIVIDDFLDADVLHTVVEEINRANRSTWHHTDKDHERKFSSEDEQGFGPYARSVIHVLNSGAFLVFLERLTGIDGLIADPHLRGGGVHEIRRGGALGVHADFNFYKRLKLYRRLNLILYLNHGWQDEWGGHLELWEPKGQKPTVRIAPIFNRAAIFDTSNFSYHGHPHPLQCPDGESRKSLALYYYTVDYPYDEDREPHSTIFVNAPNAHDH